MKGHSFVSSGAIIIHRGSAYALRGYIFCHKCIFFTSMMKLVSVFKWVPLLFGKIYPWWWGLWNSVCLGSESNACHSWVNWLSWLQWSWLSYKKPEDKTKEAQEDEKYPGRACQEKLHMHFVNISHSDFKKILIFW